ARAARKLPLLRAPALRRGRRALRLAVDPGRRADGAHRPQPAAGVDTALAGPAPQRPRRALQALPTVSRPARTHRPMTKDILKLAWPVFVGQLAVMLNGVIDTIMAGRLSAVDVAAVGLGASIYVSVYIGLMGVLLALSPIVAQHYGAQRFEQIGLETRQAVWLALLAMVPGCAAPAARDLWLALSEPPPEVAAVARTYLWAAAAGLPAALLFRVFHALSNAVSRPKAVMAINLVGVALKVPLNALFMHGWQHGDATIVPALGGAGCGVASAIVAWLSVLLALAALRAEPLYRKLGL